MSSSPRKPRGLELEIDRALLALADHNVASQDYMKTLEAISKLHKMKEEEKPSRVSKDTLVIVGANLLGILLIIRHEHVNVITSRAMNLVVRSR